MNQSDDVLAQAERHVREAEERVARQVVTIVRMYGGIDELQRDLDSWFAEYNEVRPHQG